MRARHNWSLAKALNEAHERQPNGASLAGGDRHKERKHRIDQHAVAEKPERTVSLGQNAERNLGDDVTVEERGQDHALDGRCPFEFAALGHFLRMGKVGEIKLFQILKNQRIFHFLLFARLLMNMKLFSAISFDQIFGNLLPYFQ